MKIKRRKSGWPLYLAIAFFAAAGLASFDLSFDSSIRGHTRASIHGYLTKKFDLAQKLTLKDILPAATRLPEALVTGKFPTEFDELYIDVKFKHLKKIQQDRERALKRSFLGGQDSYPARITFRGEKYKANIRLKGDFKDHWIGSDRWSFRIKLKNGAAIFGFSRFSLQRPYTRAIPNDHLFQYWLREAGNITPRHRYVRVFFNGDHWGVMDVEEHMSKHFLELAQKKNAPIVRFNTDEDLLYRKDNLSRDIPNFFDAASNTQLYNDASYRDDIDMLSLYSYGIDAKQRFGKGMLPIEYFIDIDSFSKALFTALTWNRLHTLHPNNTRYYLNPYTLKFEQITTDQPDIISHKDITQLGGGLYGKMVRSPEFLRRFESNFRDIYNTANVVEDEYARICDLFPLDCPAFDINIFRNNLEQLKASGLAWFNAQTQPTREREQTPLTATVDKLVQYSPDIEFRRNVFGEHYDDGRLIIYNIIDLPAEVLSATLKCTKKKNNGCRDRPLIRSPLRVEHGIESDGLPARITVDAPTGILGKKYVIEIVSRVAGYPQKLVSKVKLSRIHDIYNPLRDGVLGPDKIATLPFVTITGKTVHINPGIWKIDEPLILPSGVGLNILPGTTLRFSPNAYIALQRAALSALGTPDAPVTLQGIDNNQWKGVYVLEAPETSQLSYVTIKNTNALRDGVLMLTGAVTFYMADVNLANVTFDHSNAEDALNIVHSSFKLEDVAFLGTRSDAFDIDFSTGTISGATFFHIGGDGLDFSGSDVAVHDVDFENVLDKAVSAGENSSILVERINVNNVGTGVASKDGSKLTVRALTARNVDLYAGMVYRKKSHYGTAELYIEGNGHDANGYFNQIGNTLIVDGVTIDGLGLDVDQLYSQGSMKKLM